MKQRIKEYDIIRSFLIIWIVFIWHLTNYFPEGNFFHELIFNSIGGDITKFVLAAFTLLSGLFMGQKQINTFKDILQFYKVRLLRFYPLFIIASITLFFTPCSFGFFFDSKEQLLLSLFGASCFIGELPSTLWYMDMLLIFYLVTPLLLLIRKKYRVLIYLGIFFLLFCTDRYIDVLDNRVVQYSLFYMIGLFLGPLKLQEYIHRYKYIILSLALLILPIGCMYRVFYMQYIYIYILEGTLALLTILFILSVWISKNKTILKISELISYASMAMYLFHRQVYATIELIGINILFAIPLICFASYIIQYLYDLSIVKLSK